MRSCPDGFFRAGPGRPTLLWVDLAWPQQACRRNVWAAQPLKPPSAEIFLLGGSRLIKLFTGPGHSDDFRALAWFMWFTFTWFTWVGWFTWFTCFTHLHLTGDFETLHFFNTNPMRKGKNVFLRHLASFRVIQRDLASFSVIFVILEDS